MLTANADETASAEDFLEKKFETTFEKHEITLGPSLSPTLGKPDRVFTDNTAQEMMLPISQRARG